LRITKEGALNTRQWCRIFENVVKGFFNCDGDSPLRILLYNWFLSDFEGQYGFLYCSDFFIVGLKAVEVINYFLFVKLDFLLWNFYCRNNFMIILLSTTFKLLR